MRGKKRTRKFCRALAFSHKTCYNIFGDRTHNKKGSAAATTGRRRWLKSSVEGEDTHDKKRKQAAERNGYEQRRRKIGLTYEKRAKGLVKKGRAVYLPDEDTGKVIRLKDCPTCESMEDTMDNINTTDIAEAAALSEKAEAKTTNYLFFNPKEWMKHPDVQNTTVFSRFFITDPFGSGMTEVVSTGNWKWDWCEITNGMLRLERETEYHFVFWLNGGENDRSDETCMFQVIFTDNSLRANESEWEKRLCYKLNRAYIKPLKRYNGWELYDIPFVTDDHEYTQLRFTAQRAPMAVMPAKEPSFYAELEDKTDELADKRPQRHNIIFEDGWPTDTWYSTAALRRGMPPKNPQPSQTFAGNLNIDELCEKISETVNERISESIDAEFAGIIAANFGEIAQEIAASMSDNK